MELFDLTLPLGPDLPVHPGDPSLDVSQVCSHETDGFEVSRLCLGTHSGTHVEAPRHFYPDGLALSEYPLARFFGKAVVFDCRQLVHDETGDAKNRRHLRELLLKWPLARKGLVLVWTEGAPLPLWAAELFEDAGAGLLGIDAFSIDDEPYPVHRYLLGRDVLIAEGLCGLERLGSGPVGCAVLPLALTDTDAAPARAIAWR